MNSTCRAPGERGGLAHPGQERLQGAPQRVGLLPDLARIWVRADPVGLASAGATGQPP